VLSLVGMAVLPCSDLEVVEVSSAAQEATMARSSATGAELLVAAAFAETLLLMDSRTVILEEWGIVEDQ
jgi:hypothetical protein